MGIMVYRLNTVPIAKLYLQVWHGLCKLPRSNFKIMKRKQKNNPFSEQINIAENFEVEFWAKKFGIRPMALREIVNSIGTNVNELRKYFEK